MEREFIMNELEAFCKSKLYYEAALKVLETQLDIIKSEFSIGTKEPIIFLKSRL